jgi:speckle-type POZ protein
LQELESVLDDEEAADFKVIVEGKSIFTFKALLIRRSSHFRSMLDSRMKESESNELSLNDNSYDAVRTVFKFIHTDQLDLHDETAVEVLQLADMWALSRLKAMCESCIADRIVPATVCTYLLSAQKHSADALRQQCLVYINNHFGAVRDQKGRGFELLEKDVLLEIMLTVRV